MKKNLLPAVLLFTALFASCSKTSTSTTNPTSTTPSTVQKSVVEEKKSEHATCDIDSVTSSTYGLLNPQVASMIGATTKVTADLNLENNTYSLKKEYHSYVLADDGTSFVKDESGNYTTGVYVVFNFSGTLTKGSDVYTLAPATKVTYSADWSTYQATLEPAGLIPFTGGEGTEETNPEMLNYFYTPYLKLNDDNTKSMDCKIDGEALTFPGFALTEDEE